MKATELLKQDHRELISFLEAVRREPPGEFRAELFQEFKGLLQHHGSLEENHFYPSVFQLIASSTLVLSSFHQHERFEEMLSAMNPHAISFSEQVDVLKMILEWHFTEEENQLFIPTEKFLGATFLEEIGREMEPVFHYHGLHLLKHPF